MVGKELKTFSQYFWLFFNERRKHRLNKQSFGKDETDNCTITGNKSVLFYKIFFINSFT